nr:hypothetical protein [Tanacetum cinerariifolium]
DDEDDEMDVEADEEEEEEEHLAPTDSVVVALRAVDQAPSADEMDSFEMDGSAATPPPHPAYRTTARISIPAPVASDELRDTLSVLYLTSTRLRSIGINIPIRQRRYIMSRVRMLRFRTFSRAGNAINFMFIQVKVSVS